MRCQRLAARRPGMAVTRRCCMLPWHQRRSRPRRSTRFVGISSQVPPSPAAERPPSRPGAGAPPPRCRDTGSRPPTAPCRAAPAVRRCRRRRRSARSRCGPSSSRPAPARSPGSGWPGARRGARRIAGCGRTACRGRGVGYGLDQADPGALLHHRARRRMVVPVIMLSASSTIISRIRSRRSCRTRRCCRPCGPHSLSRRRRYDARQAGAVLTVQASMRANSCSSTAAMAPSRVSERTKIRCRRRRLRRAGASGHDPKAANTATASSAWIATTAAVRLRPPRPPPAR